MSDKNKDKTENLDHNKALQTVNGKLYKQCQLSRTLLCCFYVTIIKMNKLLSLELVFLNMHILGENVLNKKHYSFLKSIQIFFLLLFPCFDELPSP